MDSAKQPADHRWRFARTAGFDQVMLENGADILALPDLDQKLWAALSCPAGGMEFDTRTLTHIDADKDGHIRVPELLASVEWMGKCLKNPDDLTRSETDLPLAAINDTTPEGRQMLASARRILSNLGKAESEVITPDDTGDTVRIFADTRFNGDGVLPPASAEDEEVKKVIEDIASCIGSVPDRSGAAGVTLEYLESFFSEAQEYAEWWTQAESDTAILPLADECTPTGKL